MTVPLTCFQALVLTEVKPFYSVTLSRQLSAKTSTKPSLRLSFHLPHWHRVFVGKNDAGLCPCKYYRCLKKIMVRNHYPMPLMSTTFGLYKETPFASSNLTCYTPTIRHTYVDTSPWYVVLSQTDITNLEACNYPQYAVSLKFPFTGTTPAPVGQCPFAQRTLWGPWRDGLQDKLWKNSVPFRALTLWLNISGRNWSTDCTTGILIRQQPSSLMFLWLN